MPPAAGPGIFALADAERLTALLDAAGFTGVRTAEVAISFELPDAEEYVAVAADTGGALGLVLQAVPDTDRTALTEQRRATITRFATDDGYRIPGMALCAVAS